MVTILAIIVVQMAHLLAGFEQTKFLMSYYQETSSIEVRCMTRSSSGEPNVSQTVFIHRLIIIL